MTVSSACVREVLGSITGRVKPKTFKMVVMASLLGAHGCGVSIATDCLMSSSTSTNVAEGPLQSIVVQGELYLVVVRRERCSFKSMYKVYS